MTVTANLGASNNFNPILPVVVTGAKPATSQNGGTATNGSASGTPTATINALAGTNWLVIGTLGQNTDSTAPTVGSGQSKTINGHDTWASADGTWCQYLTGMNLAAGSSATINITAPTAIQYSMAIIEILAE
jgi:hypothetical protein